MFRRSLALAFALLVVAACGPKAEQAPPPQAAPPQAQVPAPAPPPPPPPAECEPNLKCDETTPGPVVTITVDRSAAPDKPCVRIDGKSTTVEWVPGRGVRTVKVTWKNAPPNFPVQPNCAAGNRCTIERGSWGVAHGPFCYSIEVVNENGSTAKVDPKLIVNP
jgi:hypothetical protein